MWESNLHLKFKSWPIGAFSQFVIHLIHLLNKIVLRVSSFGAGTNNIAFVEDVDFKRTLVDSYRKFAFKYSGMLPG